MEDKNLSIIGGLLLCIVTGYWFWAVALTPHSVADPPWIFLDYANLIFHEAGHFVFIFFGDFLHILGGSLMQLLIPFITLIAFLRQSELLSAGFALFWLGESASNLSYYISDARSQLLPLLGGDSSGHDWTWLLTQTNHLASDTAIGSMVHSAAIIFMSAGLLTMLWAVYRTYTKRDTL